MVWVLERALSAQRGNIYLNYICMLKHRLMCIIGISRKVVNSMIPWLFQTSLLSFYPNSAFIPLSSLISICLCPVSPIRSLVPRCSPLYAPHCPPNNGPFLFSWFPLLLQDMNSQLKIWIWEPHGKKKCDICPLSLGFLNQYNLFSFHPFTWKIHDSFLFIDEFIGQLKGM